MLRNLCILTILVVGLAACDSDPVHTPPPGEVVVVEPAADSAFLRGNLDDMDGINDYASETTMNGSSSYTDLVAYVPHEDGRQAMAILRILRGGVDHEDLAPGSAHTFNHTASDTTSLEVQLTGCLLAAPDDDGHSRLYFDDTSANVDLWVDSLPGGEVKRVNYIATWDNEVGSYTGYFDVPNY